jgi:hypothetical protein
MNRVDVAGSPRSAGTTLNLGKRRRAGESAARGVKQGATQKGPPFARSSASSSFQI